MFLPYLETVTFIDENDIFHSGLYQANGRILYKDYVSQHPPVTMFLSGLYAILGAGSVETFRLLFYITLAITFGILYFRHGESLGKVRFILFLFFTITVIFPLFNTWMLGDVVAAIGHLMILLEFIRYVQDKEIKLSRSVFISIGVFISFGSTFMSIFSIAWIVLMFGIYEVKYWATEKRTVKAFYNRYFVFVVIVAAPFLVTFIYFGANHVLKEMVRQVYLFNRQVYPYYNNGLGSSISESLFGCVSNFASFITTPALSLINGSFSLFHAFSLYVTGLLFLCLAQLVDRKQYLLAVSLLGYVVFLITRGPGFHGVAFGLSLTAVGFLMLMIPFFQVNYINTLLRTVIITSFLLLGWEYYTSLPLMAEERPTVNSSFYNIVLELVEEHGSYYYDFWSLDILYFEYKLGVPVNRTPYMLAWYMAWYSPWSLEDLDNASVVLYNQNESVWGYQYTDYNRQFTEKLLSEFSHPVGGGEYLWVRNP